MYFARTPYLLQLLNYPRDLWSMDKSRKELFLTFDDGPVPQATPWVLDILERHKAKATFFCVGDNARKYPHLLERIRQEGHAVGNHSYSHLNGWKTNDEEYIGNIFKCNEILSSGLFRPPYGKATRNQKKILREHFTIVYWSVISGDFDISLSPADCLSNVMNNATNGAVILFHDSIKAMPRLKYALPAVLAKFSAEGYSFCSIPDKAKDSIHHNSSAIYENPNR